MPLFFKTNVVYIFSEFAYTHDAKNQISMKKLLFRLDGVPDDEAAEVRALLDQHHIDYYETPGGMWGISVAGIWVSDKSIYDRAKPLLEEYAKERSTRMREEYARQIASGEAETLLQRAMRKPVSFIAAIAFAAAILYFSLMPFFWLAGE